MFTNPTSSKILLVVAIALGIGNISQMVNLRHFQEIVALEQSNALTRLDYANSELERMETRANAYADQVTQLAANYSRDMDNANARNAELAGKLTKSHVALKSASAALDRASTQLAQQHRQLVAKR